MGYSCSEGMKFIEINFQIEFMVLVKITTDFEKLYQCTVIPFIMMCFEIGFDSL